MYLSLGKCVLSRYKEPDIVQRYFFQSFIKAKLDTLNGLIVGMIRFIVNLSIIVLF